MIAFFGERNVMILVFDRQTFQEPSQPQSSHGVTLRRRLVLTAAKIIPFQRAVTLKQLGFFRIRNPELRPTHLGRLDPSFVLEDHFDARDGFDDRLTEDQFLHRFELALNFSGSVEISGASGQIQCAPLFRRDVGDADEGAVGAHLVAFRDEAIVARQDTHLGFIALERLNRIAK